MTKRELESSEAWKTLGPNAPLRYGSLELCNVSREHYPDKDNPQREAIILRGSPLGISMAYSDRHGLESCSAYYHASVDSVIICRKDGVDHYPGSAVAEDGVIALI